MILGVPVCGLDALWKFHVDVHFDRSLWIGHNIVLRLAIVAPYTMVTAYNIYL